MLPLPANKKDLPLRARVIFCVLSGLLVCMPNAWASVSPRDFKDEQSEHRYQRLVKELRCPKCQNQNLYASDAPIAIDLREQLYLQIAAGLDDEAIIAFMTSRYGDFIRYRPRFSGAALFVWLSPLVLLFIGGIVVWRHLGGSQGAAPARINRREALSDSPPWTPWLLWSLFPVGLFLALGLYAKLGAFGLLRVADHLHAEDHIAARRALAWSLRFTGREDVESWLLLGNLKLEAKDFVGTAEAWERALALLPPDEPSRAAFVEQISRARRLALAGEIQADQKAPRLLVKVDLDPAIQAPAEAMVYVFARETSGMPMPVAVARLPVSKLPAQVVLDDSLAMAPSARLSGAQEVIVVARISLDGDAMPSTGDSEGRSLPLTVKPGLQEVTVRIDSPYAAKVAAPRVEAVAQ